MSEKKKRPQRPKRPTFGEALYIARQIEVPKDPEEENLHQMVKSLDRNQQKSLVFKMAEECIRMRVQPPAVFAAAYPARMLSVAHATASIRKAMDVGNLTLTDLVELGFLNVKVSKGRHGQQNERWVAYVGKRQISDAISTLRDWGEKYSEAIKPLEEHLFKSEEQKLIRQAKKEARKKAKEVRKNKKRPTKKPGVADTETKSGQTTTSDTIEQPKVEATPAAKKAAEESGISLQEISGTGKEGKITKKDVEKHLSS